MFLSLRGMAAIGAGNALAFYDFLTFSFFAVQIGHTFFSGSPSGHSLLLSLAIFGAGFAARPLGALVIGTYGDRAGRKPAMQLSFALMGLGVVALALTPSAATIGATAAVLLLIFRLLQGFAVGGELGPAIAFLVEAAPPDRRALYASVQSATQGLAVLAAGVVGFGLTSALSSATFEKWGWRIAFLMGALIVPVGFYVRRNVTERTHDAADSSLQLESPVQAPLRVIVAGVLIVGALTIANYVRTYITTYAQNTLQLATNLAFGATIGQGLGTLCAAPLAGLLADKFGRKPVALSALPLSVVLGIPLFAAMGHAHFALTIYALTFALSALGTLISVPAITMVAESLPKAARSGSLAMLYAVTIAVFGGSTQLVVQKLIEVTGSTLAPAWYQTVALVIGGAAIAAVSESAPCRHSRGRGVCHS